MRDDFKRKFTRLKDKKVRIIGSKSGSDFRGCEERVYFDVFGKKLWANYRSVSGHEFYAAASHGFDEEAVFTINWHKEVKPGMHVVYNGKAFEIVYIDDLEGYKQDLKLHCKTSDYENEVLSFANGL